MIRFIIKKEHKTCDSSPMVDYQTLVLDVPELEKVLVKGGYDQYFYEHYSLVGVEIVGEKEKEHGNNAR